MQNGLLDEMRKLNLHYTRVVGGRILFALIPNGTECIYFKSWDEVSEYIKWRNESGVSKCL